MRVTLHVLVLVDDRGADGIALRRVLALATRRPMRITLLDVVTDGDSAAGWIGVSHERIEARRQALAAVAAASAGPQVPVTSRVRAGALAEEILDEARQHGHDLVVLARRPADLLDRVFGTVERRLLREAPCPVWVVRADNAGRAGVMAAVAVHAEDPQRDALELQVLTVAARLAELEERALDVVHAWTFVGEGALRARPHFIPGAAVTQLVRAELRRREAHVARLLRRVAPRCECRIHFEKGYPEAVVPPLASRLRADVIVAGTLGRRGIVGLTVGNTVEALLDRAPCGVLAVPPGGSRRLMERVGGSAPATSSPREAVLA